jgi:hypothetical protein
MATKVQLTGGAFQDSEGNVLANGYLRLYLNQDASVTGTATVCSGIYVQIALDSNGNISASPTQSVWGNDQLSPANTYYRVYGYTASAQLAWGPNNQQVIGNGGTFNVGTWVPNQVFSWTPSSSGVLLQTNGTANGSQVKFNAVAGTNMTITDDGSGDITFAASGGGGGAGSLSASSAIQASPLTVNLSTEGTYDWMYLGGFAGAAISGNCPEASSAFKPHYKFLNGRLINNLRLATTAQNAAGTSSSQFTFNSVSGDDASFDEAGGASSPFLINRAASPFWLSNNNGLFFYPFGFQWRDIPLSTTAARTLRFYVFINNCTATLTARLSDGSAADVSTSVTNGSTAEYIITVNVTPGNASATLSVTLLCSSFNTSASQVGISAVTMA